MRMCRAKCSSRTSSRKGLRQVLPTSSTCLRLTSAIKPGASTVRYIDLFFSPRHCGGERRCGSYQPFSRSGCFRAALALIPATVGARALPCVVPRSLRAVLGPPFFVRSVLVDRVGFEDLRLGMRPRPSRPDALQSVTVLEVLEALSAQHGAEGVPFKELEAETRSRLNYRALTDALNALVNDGAVRRVTEKPARLAITEAGRRRLGEYRS